MSLETGRGRAGRAACRRSTSTASTRRRPAAVQRRNEPARRAESRRSRGTAPAYGRHRTPGTTVASSSSTAITVGRTDGAHPSYSTANVQRARRNGSNAIPSVMSINCSSGAYDYDETSFAFGSLVKANGGAVGVFGRTRATRPRWHNTQIGLGFVDGRSRPFCRVRGRSTKLRSGRRAHQRQAAVGRALAAGATDGSTRNELYLWHYFGDPSMKMWGGRQPAVVLDPSLINARFVRQAFGPGPDPAPYSVHVTVPEELNGQPISLLRNGDVVWEGEASSAGRPTSPRDFGGDSPNGGRAPGGRGRRTDSPPVQAPVSGVPTRRPSLTARHAPQRRSRGEDSLPTTGTLSPGFAGAQIVVKYTPPDGATFERTVTTTRTGTGATRSRRSTTPASGRATGRSRRVVAGDSQRYPSTASECTVFVFDNS